jgi:hypothetical protein
MSIDEIVELLDNGRVVEITSRDLSSILEHGETRREDRTGIAGTIRTLSLGDRVLVQERTPEGDYFVRRLPSEQAARLFVDARLAAYERMWDG